jgi:hypothetical protein
MTNINYRLFITKLKRKLVQVIVGEMGELHASHVNKLSKSAGSEHAVQVQCSENIATIKLT